MSKSTTAQIVKELARRLEEVIYNSEDFIDATYDAVADFTGVTEEYFDSNYEGSDDYDEKNDHRQDQRTMLITAAFKQLVADAECPIRV